MVLVLAGGALAAETLVVPQGTTHTVTGKELYDSFEVAGTLIVEKGGELTAGLGTEKSVIDGLEAKVIVNGGVIKLNSRIDVGDESNAAIIMNGGLFRIGDANSIDDAGDIKMPDNDGGTQRIILNGGLLWAHRCQMKFAVTDDAKIIVAGGEMRLDKMGEGEDPGEPESYYPKDWLSADRLLLAENKGYTELVISPNTPVANYYKISAIAKPLEALVVPQGATHTVTGKERYKSFEVAGTLIVEKGGELTAGLGTDQPRSTIDGLEAKVIVNGGVINLNSRINVGYASNATIIMNGGLFRIGNLDSEEDFGDIKLPDSDGGTQRIILNGGLLWVHRCQMKITQADDAQIIVGGGEMRLDILGEDEVTESYVPESWQTAGRLLLAKDKGYTELVISPSTPAANYYSIRAIGAKAGSFHFTLTGDPRSGLSRWRHMLKQMKEKIGGVGAFHITAGDYFEDDHSTLASHFYDEMVAEFGPDVVWYPGVGNHEVQREQHDLLWLRQFYRDKLQGKVNAGPQGSEETSYSWDYRNAHFVQIDMYFDGEKHREDVGFSDQILEWLEKDLDKNTRPVVFVIYHEPAWPNDRGGKDSPDNWQKFMKILNDRKVVAGFCAHTHTYGRTQVPGPWESVTWEIDAGNAGRLSHGDKHQTFVDIIVKPDGTVEFNTWQGLEGEDFKITDSWTAKAGTSRNTGKLVEPENQSVFDRGVEMRLATTAVR